VVGSKERARGSSKLLLRTKGINLDSKDPKYSQMPLSRALGNGLEAVLKLLLAIESVDPSSKANNSETPLLFTARDGHKAVVKLLLETEGVDLDSKDSKYSQAPISWAAENRHEAVVKLLLKKGTELESKDKNGRTPLLCHGSASRP
jgi:ankyrin repeat protein